MLALARDTINQRYAGYVHICTDASITSSGRAGIGCYIQSNSVTLEIEEAARITDGVTILSAEMTAIKSAFDKIQLLEKTTWQKDWDTNPKSRHFQQICPTVTTTWRPKFHSKTTEVLAHYI